MTRSDELCGVAGGQGRSGRELVEITIGLCVVLVAVGFPLVLMVVLKMMEVYR